MPGPPVDTTPVYESPVRTVATVLHVRKPGVFDVRLPNGKISCAHLPKALAARLDDLVPGSRVIVDLTPFDFDTARISGVADDAAAGDAGTK